MAPAPEQCAQELARLLNAQTEVCAGILEKSRTQQRLVEERDEEKLLSLLADKQSLIDRHQKLAEETNPVRAAWEAGARERAAPGERALVERAWSSLRDVLDEIVKLEDASRAMLEEQKGRLSVDIGNLQRGKIVNKAYGGAKMYRPPAAPRYSDKQG
ncbi:MAG: flagellar protein FlgN [Planctomycetota bacterium]|jgi:seryl-tRNA synthetase|nr:flagellar protein FlgN [Planctomycetota bacterium]